eukprot:CAMPEP_0115035220 /NCGR_PEP_ID=MMETSP0216-20121206/41278_1 /TAXON_ID=223996 /ORGANISM="Protocruzia adherens, Strain Boccale" /LENGTH=321 /DNA_ID=CAMNT_0002414577 /DNA_START=35 /DNA_END=1000 /DNA_ORIENTATION=-
MEPSVENVENEDVTFTKLFGVEQNKRCFECGSDDNVWASLTWGIFLCIDCAGRHRLLGIQTSFVRSIQHDTWTPDQLKCMTYGGNKELEEWFAKYNVPPNSPLDFKYNTECAHYFKRRLRALANNMEWEEEEPSVEDGLKLKESTSFNGVGMSAAAGGVGLAALGASHAIGESDDGDFKTKAGNFFRQLGTSLEGGFHVAKEKTVETGHKIGEKMPGIGEKIKTGSSELATKIKAGSSELGSKIKTGSSELGTKIKTGTANLGEKINPKFQSAKESTKEGLNKAGTAIKGATLTTMMKINGLFSKHKPEIEYEEVHQKQDS